MTELRATQTRGRTASLRETWYGDAEHYRGGTRLIVKIGPDFPVVREESERERVLVFNVGQELTPGPMVLATTRVIKLPKGYWDMPVNERFDIPKGKPEFVVDISFDPSTTDGCGAWQGRLTGEWPVRLTVVRRKSLWDRLILGPEET